MVLLDDEIYHGTVDLLLGKASLSPMARELAAWLKTAYDVTMLNFQFGKLAHCDGNRYRLYLILKDTRDFMKMHHERFRPNEAYQAQIEREFGRLAAKYGYTAADNLNNLFVCYNDFSDEAKTDANWKTIKKAWPSFQDKYPCVWYIMAPFAHVIIFYYTDDDIVLNQNNGVSEKVKLDYFSILKENDQFDYYNLSDFVVRFDSKKNLDRNYQGSLFYYARDN